MFVRRIGAEDTGAATGMTVGLIAGLMACVAAVCVGIALLAQWQSAQYVADFSALAAADAASGRIPGYPCAIAQRHAEMENYLLESCEIDQEHARVTLRVTIAGINVRFRAHAGPQNSDVDLTGSNSRVS